MGSIRVQFMLLSTMLLYCVVINAAVEEIMEHEMRAEDRCAMKMKNWLGYITVEEGQLTINKRAHQKHKNYLWIDVIYPALRKFSLITNRGLPTLSNGSHYWPANETNSERLTKSGNNLIVSTQSAQNASHFQLRRWPVVCEETEHTSSTPTFVQLYIEEEESKTIQLLNVVQESDDSYDFEFISQDIRKECSDEGLNISVEPGTLFHTTFNRECLVGANALV